MINDLKGFLEEKYDKYNRIDFIESDPISIPHQFSQKEDIEIAGFLTATISWGQRITIINNANKMMKLMGNQPYDFLMTAQAKDLQRFDHFVHRTFNGVDAAFFFKSLKNIYLNHGGLENVFQIPLADKKRKTGQTLCAIMNFRRIFFSIEYPHRTGKHVSNPAENSSAKRLCMYLRWMVRHDIRGVDFGIWKTNLKSSQLMCPLDVHSGNVARKLGLLIRTQNDWKAVDELTSALSTFDAKDPVKYDFALFGLGVFEKF